MSRSFTFSFTAVGQTDAGFGRSTGGHSLIADRPAGVAGGCGLGFTGEDLLAASLGGCFWNHLHVAAQDRAHNLRVEQLDARVDLAGDPPRIVRARISAKLAGADEDSLARVFEAACDASTIANSLILAFPISFERL